MEVTLKQIAEWTNGRVAPQYEQITVSGFGTDSRTVQDDQMFVALKGERYDGHDFLPHAIRSCRAVLAEKEPADDFPAVLVADTTVAYGKMARGRREQLNMKVVGVTGSVGKTTTKEMIAAVLESTYQTGKTQGNHNNQIGLPETILGLEDDTRIAVIEMGMNHFGEMSYLSQIALPDIAVITNIGTAHIEYLGSREGILKAKLEILDGLRPNGLLLLNGDEPLLWALKDTLDYKVLYYGIENEACDYRAMNVRQTNDGVSFHLTGSGENFELFVPSPGTHNIYNALAAIAVGLYCGIPAQIIQKALVNFQNTGMRQKIYETNDLMIIEDCYNAGPESMAAALSVLKNTKCSGRKIAVLGDMLELGSISHAEHYRVGRIAAQSADLVFAYGSYSDLVHQGAVTGGLSENAISKFDNHEQMAKMLFNRVKPGDVLLFKGSRGTRMEHVLELFLKRISGK